MEVNFLANCFAAEPIMTLFWFYLVALLVELGTRVFALGFMTRTFWTLIESDLSLNAPIPVNLGFLVLSLGVYFVVLYPFAM